MINAITMANLRDSDNFVRFPLNIDKEIIWPDKYWMFDYTGQHPFLV